MTDNTPLGDRMKRYESAFRTALPRRTYTLMRLDGRAFHTYLKGCDKPYDMGFVKDMSTVAEVLCREIQGAQLAYTQSDEVSLLITDFQSLQSEPWFGGRVDKMTSVSASLAAVTMHDRRRHITTSKQGVPQFDCRVWSMSDPVEVANYFIWRQRDAIRNSILMLAQHYYSQSSLNGRSTNELQDILFREQGVNWNDVDPGIKRGRVVANLGGEARNVWQVTEAPHFAAEPDGWLATVIPPLPSLNGD